MPFSILVVDDSAVMRSVIERAIGMSGLPVQTCLSANGGQAALKLLEQHHVDLILTDLNMPGMDGEALVRQLQQKPGLKKIPYIVLSADATSRRIQKMLDLGASGYIAKPFRAENLRSQMARVLDRKHDRN